MAKFSLKQRVRVPERDSGESRLRGLEGTITYVSGPASDSPSSAEQSYIVKFDDRDIQLRMIRESQIEAV